MLARTSLTDPERALLDRFLPELLSSFGDRIEAVWLYGSRARGEAPRHEDSDVDLIVLLDVEAEGDWDLVQDVLRRAGTSTGDLRTAFTFSVKVHDLGWLDRRREIKSFYIAEVDRDKIVLHGDAGR